MYISVMHLLSRRLMPVPFRISVHSVHFTRSSASHKTVQQTHNFSSMSTVRSVLFPASQLYPYLVLVFKIQTDLFPRTTSVFLSIPLLSVRCSVLTACASRLTVRWSLYFVAFGCVCRVFIHSVFCVTTGPKPPLKRFLHIVRSRASFFK